MMMCYLKYVLFIIWLVQGTTQSSNITNAEKRRSLPVVDALISQLQQEHWGADDAACLRVTLALLHAVRNHTLWAVWVWDSIQLPSGSMYGAEAYVGNYDQCLGAPWSQDTSHPGLRSQYCLVEVNSPGVDHSRQLGPYDDAAEYYRIPTKDSRHFNQHYFGVCLPSVCSPAAVGRVAHHLLRLTHLPGTVRVDFRYCDTGEAVTYSTGFYVFCVLFGLLTITSVTSTLCTTTAVTSNILETIKKSFCLRRNFATLFTVSSADIRSLHGMRFVTAILVVVIHEIFYQVLLPNTNGLDVNKKMTSKFIQSVLHIDVAVDTFFAISGLLIIRGLFMRKQHNLFTFLSKRYLRLIGPYGLTIMFTTTAILFVDRGPIWKKTMNMEVDVCKDNWWKALFMVNTDLETMCNITTWYISCDFQLAIMATCFFYVYKKNKKLSYIGFLMTAVSLTLYLGFTVFQKKLDIMPFNYRSFRMKRKFTEANYTYLKSHTRAGSYFVGMAMGYLVATYKPERYRNVINKRWSIILAIVSGIIMCVIVSLGLFITGRSYDPMEAAVVVATNRIIWAIAVCCIIGLCEYGTLPKVPELLSWHVFVPLSKLSYCLYLIHPLLIQIYKYNARGPHFINYYNMIIQACGILVVGCGTSFIMYLIIEAPFINISNMLLSKNQEQQTIKESTADIKLNGNAVSKNVDENDDSKKTKLL